MLMEGLDVDDAQEIKKINLPRWFVQVDDDVIQEKQQAKRSKYSSTQQEHILRMSHNLVKEGVTSTEIHILTMWVIEGTQREIVLRKDADPHLVS